MNNSNTTGILQSTPTTAHHFDGAAVGVPVVASDNLRVLSLGWGVQSFTLAAMVALGVIAPVAVAVHADTGHERKATYDFALRATGWLKLHSVMVHTVHPLNNDVVLNGSVMIPAYTVGQDGQRGRIRRQCTGDWKIDPVRRYVQSVRQGRRVDMLLGITTDEFQRAKDAHVKYINNIFPLLDMGFSRADCVEWLQAQGLEVPAKSSCVFCPFLTKAAWEDMRRVGGSDWQQAIEVDSRVRTARLPGELFIHSKRVSLPQAVTVPEQFGYSQLDMLASADEDAECDSGACFL